MKIVTSLFVLLLLLGFNQSANGDVIFSDNFDSASPEWGNQVGNWTDAGGVYNATSPSSFPNAHSTLDFNFTDFVVEVDVNSVADGGIWLRSTERPGTAVGVQGVLLVTGAGGTGGTGLYWHIVGDGSGYGSALDLTSGLFGAGSNPNIRVEVEGDTYSAFVNGSSTAATSITTSTFASGGVGLYDFSGQSFDNFVLSIPEPTSSGALGLMTLGYLMRCRKR